MPNYKLTYFNARGRAEVSRLLFAAAGQKYEDVRLAFEDWPKVKPTTPWGTIPVLEVNGKQLGESVAIAGFLAAEFGLMGKNTWDAAVVRSLVYKVDEIKSKAVPIFFVKDKPEQERQRTEFLEKKVKPVLEQLEALLNMLKANNDGKDWLVGKGMTWADLHLYDTVEILGSMEPAVLGPYPILQGLCARVEAVPRIAKWLKDRPQDKQKLVL